jgi:plasmid stabilization system protein ParE
VIALAPEAEAQLAALELYYLEKRRPQALRNLAHALAEVSLLILDNPGRGAAAPRPYPELAEHGLLWLKQHRYWFAYDPKGPTIAGIFFETSDMPGRMP